MNREILFRAKSGQTWYYGDIHKGRFYFSKTSDDYDYRYYLTTETDEEYRVSPNTICQYTGLTDKNGTKIFEGDILHFGDKNYLVFWNDECFQWQMRTRKDGFSFPIYFGQDTGCPVECITLSWVAAEIPIIGTMSTEIVGNIYDNSDLIEK